MKCSYCPLTIMNNQYFCFWVVCTTFNCKYLYNVIGLNLLQDLSSSSTSEGMNNKTIRIFIQYPRLILLWCSTENIWGKIWTSLKLPLSVHHIASWDTSSQWEHLFKSTAANTYLDVTTKCLDSCRGEAFSIFKKNQALMSCWTGELHHPPCSFGP